MIQVCEPLNPKTEAGLLGRMICGAVQMIALSWEAHLAVRVDQQDSSASRECWQRTSS